jgi:thiol-disulfide isomerase/thioredoxin
LRHDVFINNLAAALFEQMRRKRKQALKKNQTLKGLFANLGKIGIILLAVLLFAPAASAQKSAQNTVEAVYPGLSSGLLRGAGLAALDGDTLLTAPGIKIDKAQVAEKITDAPPAVRQQLDNNLFFVLEQAALRQALVNKAKDAGVSVIPGNEDQAIQQLFVQMTKDVSVSQEEAQSFYKNHEQMMGGAPFEAVEEAITRHLAQEKKQNIAAEFVDGLEQSINAIVNKDWVKEQAAKAMDNPVDKARRSGKATLVEFGASGCEPCDLMQPILERLKAKFPKTLNVVFVHVQEQQILAARYGIRSIPVQAFFDAEGKESFRHTGFFPQEKVEEQLAGIGVK